MMMEIPKRGTAEYVEWIYRQPMKPCPKCGAYNMKPQTPIKMSEDIGSTAESVVGAWARAQRGGATPLEGPVYMMCFDCGHKGPAADCSGRTSQDVGKDANVNSEIKRLWNNQVAVK